MMSTFLLQLNYINTKSHTPVLLHMEISHIVHVVMPHILCTV